MREEEAKEDTGYYRVNMEGCIRVLLAVVTHPSVLMVLKAISHVRVQCRSP